MWYLVFFMLQNSFIPINYDNTNWPFHAFEASVPNSYAYQQYNIIHTIIHTYKAKNVLLKNF